MPSVAKDDAALIAVGLEHMASGMWVKFDSDRTKDRTLKEDEADLALFLPLPSLPLSFLFSFLSGAESGTSSWSLEMDSSLLSL